MMKSYDELLKDPKVKEKVNKAIDALDESKSVVINSKVGMGKTTLLRLVAYALVKYGAGRGIAFDKHTTDLEPLSEELAGASVLDFNEDFYEVLTNHDAIKNDSIFFIDEVSNAELMNNITDTIRAGHQVVFTVHCDDEEDALEKRILQLTEHAGLTNLMMDHTVGIRL